MEYYIKISVFSQKNSGPLYCKQNWRGDICNRAWRISAHIINFQDLSSGALGYLSAFNTSSRPVLQKKILSSLLTMQPSRAYLSSCESHLMELLNQFIV
jgi:hypothetical protein